MLTIQQGIALGKRHLLVFDDVLLGNVSQTVLVKELFDEVFGIRNLLGLAAIFAAVILLAINENKARQGVLEDK